MILEQEYRLMFPRKKQLAYEQVSQAGFLTIGDKQNRSCLLNTR